jgi:hypothetical protein
MVGVTIQEYDYNISYIGTFYNNHDLCQVPQACIDVPSNASACFVFTFILFYFTSLFAIEDI